MSTLTLAKENVLPGTLSYAWRGIGRLSTAMLTCNYPLASVPRADRSEKKVANLSRDTKLAVPDWREGRLGRLYWEEMRTYCVFVICVVDGVQFFITRREDNDDINVTKLLRVTSLKESSRRTIREEHKDRTVIREGVRDLIGTWISFKAAKEIAEKQKILNQVYPLFEDGLAMIPEKVLIIEAKGFSMVANGKNRKKLAGNKTPVKQEIGCL